MSWIHARRSSLFALAAILLVAGGLRLWRIDTLPPGFHFDESFEGLQAWRILTDSSYRPLFLTGNFGVPPLNAYANALAFGFVRLLGGEAGPTVMRATSALFGVLGVLAVYALGTELRRLDPQRITFAFPLLAAALLATMRWHIHFSRMGIEPILVPLLWAAATWLLLRGWRTREWWSFAGCGVLLAACVYTYQGAWIIPLLMIPTVAHLWLHGRRPMAQQPALPPGGRPHKQGSLRPVSGALLAAAVALLLVLPLGWFFAANPDLLLLRPSQIALSGEQTAAPATVWDNVRASALMFVPLGGTGDLDPRRNLPGEAALNWWQFAPFFAGLLLALGRVRSPAYTILLFGLAGLLLPGVFSEYAPHFHRILGAAAPAALLAGLGLDALVRLGAQWAAPSRGRSWPLWAASSCAALLLAGAAAAGHSYFVRWAALPDLFYAFDTGLWRIGQEIAQRPASEAVYLTPRAADHPTLAFALAVSPQRHAPPVSFDGRRLFPLTAGANADRESYFVIEHEDFRTRLLLPAVLPAATIVETILEPDGAAYANVYARPPAEMPQRPPQHVVAAVMDESITLAGYDVEPARLQPGALLYLQLHWLVNQAPNQDWTVFTHLLKADGSGGFVQVAGEDSEPGGGSLPTSRWQEGWRVLDEYQLALPAELAPGVYALAAGLYQPDGSRLPADGPGVLLGDVTVE